MYIEHEGQFLTESADQRSLSGGFYLGWPVAGMGSMADPEQFGMFKTL